MPGLPVLDTALRRRLGALTEEGWEIWARFDREVRQDHWHSFVPADYDRVMDTLIALREPGLRFLEWGSATGVITIMADLLGYEAFGIELDGDLVRIARQLASEQDSGARFAVGSFLPAGYVWRGRDGDARTGTVGLGESGYVALGRPLDEFDVVYGYPWAGEEPMMVDLMQAYGRRDALLLIQRVSGEIAHLRGGRGG